MGTSRLASVVSTAQRGDYTLQVGLAAVAAAVAAVALPTTSRQCCQVASLNAAELRFKKSDHATAADSLLPACRSG